MRYDRLGQHSCEDIEAVKPSPTDGSGPITANTLWAWLQRNPFILEHNMPFVKKMIVPVILLCFSTVAALVFLELGLRLVLDPVNYLKPTMVTDPVLGHRITPKSAWHDDWGFRNHSVPQQVDIVAIGDSMTYGNQALAKDAWPSVLSQLTGQSVYNMGHGGYGPLQYWFLMVNKALQMKPKTIVVGLYIGNDIIDAFHLAYQLEPWKAFRAPGTDFSLPPGETTTKGVSFMSGTPGWLIQFFLGHSILFRMLLESAVGDLIHQARNLFQGVDLGFVNFKDEGQGDGTLVTVNVHGKPVAVQNGYVLPAIDLENPSVASGLDVTIRALSMMQRFCAGKGIELVVLLIPTKDTVLAELLAPETRTPQYVKTVEQETKIRNRLKSACDKVGIFCLDVLPDMQKTLQTGLPYFVDTENHPNKVGYAVIATSVARFLGQLPPQMRQAVSNGP